MQDFIFHNPTKIVFGKDSVNKLGSYAAEIGSKALLVYGQNSIKSTGLYERIIKDLNNRHISFIEHGGVKPNPTLSHAREGVRKAVENQCDYIIAVGGGSVIDEAKAIAASVGSKKDIWEFFTMQAPITKALPLITVLTVPATGSEMNGNMVITNDETHDKLGLGNALLFPAVSILDPVLTYTIPLRYTAYAAVDIVSHLTESYFNNNGGWTVLQQYYVEGMVKTVIEAMDKLLNHPQDYDARATFMWAATMGWNGLNTAGLGAFQMICHTLEHPVSAVYDIAHGAGLSIITPAWLKTVINNKTAKIARFAREVFGVKENDDLKAAEQGIRFQEAWYTKIGAPTTFKQAGIDNPDLSLLTELTIKAAGLRNMTELTETSVMEIYKKCL